MGKYVKGHTSTPEEEYKRIESLRESWKNRSDYIADIVQLCPELHTKWRGFRFTVKGKRIGCSEEWKNYRVFFNDVYPSYRKGFVLVRPDITKPFSKDNFAWIHKKDMSIYKSGSVRLTYDGETLLLRDWAEKLNISLNGLRIRYHKHKNDYSVEEILFGRKKKRCSKEIKGFTDKSVSMRAKASKMISSYKHKDKIMGVSVCDMDINWAMENIFSKPCVYCGDTYRIGADRISNDKGHTKDNIVPCCFECNCAKNDNFSYEEMLIIGKTIAKVKAQRSKIEREKIDMHAALNPLNPGVVRWHQKTLQYDLNNNLVGTFDSVRDAAEKTGYPYTGIRSACCKPNRPYRGFYWKHEKY